MTTTPTPSSPKPPATRAPQSKGSSCTTNGIRVDVLPKFDQSQSDPSARQWLFSYRIRISNEGTDTVQLVSRHWVIVDAHGQSEDVKGPGVVGQQPKLGPGQTFEYTSFCPMRTSWGTMEGSYQFLGSGGEKFGVSVARFYLVAGAES